MRGLTLKLPEQESPYFIEYRVRDINSTTVYASFGVTRSRSNKAL